MSEHSVDMIVSVIIMVNNRDVIDRVVNNTPDMPGGRPWRSNFYDLQTEEDVLEHLAYNCINNGFHQANSLDGWADLDDDAATMDIAEVQPL